MTFWFGCSRFNSYGEALGKMRINECRNTLAHATKRGKIFCKSTCTILRSCYNSLHFKANALINAYTYTVNVEISEGLIFRSLAACCKNLNFQLD